MSRFVLTVAPRPSMLFLIVWFNVRQHHLRLYGRSCQGKFVIQVAKDGRRNTMHTHQLGRCPVQVQDLHRQHNNISIRACDLYVLYLNLNKHKKHKKHKILTTSAPLPQRVTTLHLTTCSSACHHCTLDPVQCFKDTCSAANFPCQHHSSNTSSSTVTHEG